MKLKHIALIGSLFPILFSLVLFFGVLISADSDDENSSTRGEITEDPAASQAFQKSEDEIYTKELHTALEEAMTQNLTEREAHILRSRYYDCQSLQAVGNELGVQRETIRQIEHRCIRKLQKLPKLQRWHDDIVSTRAWQGTGFGAWNHRGSVEERTVEYLDDWEAKNRAWAAEREKLIREHYADLEAAGCFDRHPEWRANLEPRTDPKESTPPGGEV